MVPLPSVAFAFGGQQPLMTLPAKRWNVQGAVALQSALWSPRFIVVFPLLDSASLFSRLCWRARSRERPRERPACRQRALIVPSE